jgi:hypothetical protein
MTGFAPANRLLPRLAAVVALSAGCSLQDFAYLNGGGGGSGGAGDPSSGNSSSGGTKLQGASGDQTSGAVGAGGSAAGSEATNGGEPGEMPLGGAPSEPAAGAPNAGTGAVGELVNPSFETSNTMGWTVEPADALIKKHAYVQWPVGGASVPDGNYELSTWHMTDMFSVEVYQTIMGLEDGTYTFKGYFSRGDGFNSTQMFARNCGGAEVEPVPVPLTEPTQWLAVPMTGIEVVGGSCEVGVLIDSNANNWLNADLFSFEKETQ